MIKYLFFIFIFVPFLAFSGVIPEKSRIVYKQGNALQSYVLVNTNKYPVIVQLWVDDGDYNKNQVLSKYPFIVTPVMSKMDSLRLNSFKVIYTGEGKKLPEDRESLFWLNIFEVPPVDNASTSGERVTLSMLTQIKLIYRPKSLFMDENNLLNTFNLVRFTAKDDSNSSVSVIVSNPTKYVVSMSGISLKGKSDGHDITLKPTGDSSLTLLPESENTLYFNTKIQSNAINNVDYWLIDDDGKFFHTHKQIRVN